jgi:hypothetical protein
LKGRDALSNFSTLLAHARILMTVA